MDSVCNGCPSRPINAHPDDDAARVGPRAALPISIIQNSKPVSWSLEAESFDDRKAATGARGEGGGGVWDTT